MGDQRPLDGIAIVGMAGRFPGASDLTQYWDNLARGVESIRFFTREELLQDGIDPAVVDQPRFIPASGYLEDSQMFDAYFFGISHVEAELMDPQHRLFLEQSWAALESAGYDPSTYDGAIGVFGGMSLSTYLVNNLLRNRRVQEEHRTVELRIHTDKDFLAALVSYKLDLRGPSMTVQTACSTSLVAVGLACQSLMTYQCDMALAGGVSAVSPTKSGMVAQPDFFASDGHCRAFDAAGSGTPCGYGVGVVVLKRLADAVADRDTIRAVIRGFGINNDGALKVGFYAPSVEGQAEAIAMAQAMAGVDPSTVGFIEAHGTGTPLGDPIEVAALTRVFRASTDRKGFCALGSVKTNIGHLDAAAGAASLIKTVLALEHGQVPPSLNFDHPNPNIDFANSPFFVNTLLLDWPAVGPRRRAGISAFAVGGVNAHLVVEEAPPLPPTGAERSPHLLVLSARTETALEAATDRLVDLLRRRPDLSFADAVYTLQVGRRAFNWRRALVCAGREDAVAALAGRDPRRLLTRNQGGRRRPVFFLFPGLGEQYPDMARELYDEEPAFRQAVDECCDLLAPHLGFDLRPVLYPGDPAAARQGGGRAAASGLDLRRLLAPRQAGAEREIDRTLYAQPAVFVVEYALARLWRHLGIEPQGLAGFSLGEYVAACLAEVMPLADALRLVALRARLISGLPRGAMLAVGLPEEELRPLLAGRPLSLAAVSGAQSAVVAGPEEQVAALERDLSGRGLTALRLRTSHAFHCAMMEPVRQATVELLRQVELREPCIPFLSNVTGTWITSAEATNPEYWGRHLVGTVRFADNLGELWRDSSAVLLEVGPGRTLGALALQHPARQDEGGAVVLPTLRDEESPQGDRELLLETLGRLWLAGLEVRWPSLHAEGSRRRIELPTYPFERQRYWVEPDPRLRDATLPAPLAAEAAEPSAAAAAPAPAAAPAGAQASNRHRRPNLDNAYVAPRSEVESQVAETWGEILRLEQVGVHDNYFSLGGDSTLAPRLLLRLHERTGVKLTLKSLFQAPTVAEMARMIRERRGEDAAPAEPAGFDLAAEAFLDPAIVPEGELRGYDDPRAVFLTGATGFLGAFLLAELLTRTRADIHCLVRAETPEAGLARIRRNLESYGLGFEAASDRIHAVPGDLSRPLLGLRSDHFDELAALVDTVYHCGAWVNTTYDYEALKAANVLGVQEGLRLAARSRTKPFCFVSTLAVLTRGSLSQDFVACEDAELDPADDPGVGYVRSKRVAERLVALARERGIPTLVFRPTFIGGHSLTGIGNHRDLVWSVLKGCLQLGASFELDEEVGITPVDYVCEAIVHLSRRADYLGGRFHLVAPGRLTWTRLFDVARGQGYPLASLPFDRWRNRLLEATSSESEQALIPFLPLLSSSEVTSREAPGSGPPPVRFDDANARAALAGSGIRCPEMSEELVARYIAGFVERGLLPPPPREELSTSTLLAGGSVPGPEVAAS